MSFYFLTEFFKYFFRVLHEASSSWLQFVHAFQKHSVYYFLHDPTISIEKSRKFVIIFKCGLSLSVMLTVKNNFSPFGFFSIKIFGPCKK
jgi:hypothetical protein